MRWPRTSAACRPRARKGSGRRLLAGAAAAACALAGCGGGGPHVQGAGPGEAQRSGGQAPRAPAAPISVVVSAFPLAQLVSYIGSSDVHVVDLAAAGVQPQGLRIGPAQLAQMKSAALVVYVGDGYQPGVEAAAGSARRRLAVLPAISKQLQPYQFWLDPYLMATAAAKIAGALGVVDPAGRRQFANGAQDFAALAQSIESDFVNSFSTCSQSYFVTSDDAFGRMAESFDLVDVPVDRTGVAQAAATVSQRQLTEVFGETGVSPSQVDQVARTAGVKVVSLDPMELAPLPGSPPESYFSVMEQDLSTLESGLDCNASGIFS